jgi:hypothetical protein
VLALLKLLPLVCALFHDLKGLLLQEQTLLLRQLHF